MNQHTTPCSEITWNGVTIIFVVTATIKEKNKHCSLFDGLVLDCTTTKAIPVAVKQSWHMWVNRDEV